MGRRITVLRRSGSSFEAVASDGQWFRSRAVIVATGAFGKPAFPAMSGQFPTGIQQIHIAEFRNASSITQEPVLVVGDGASGRDAALALASTHRTYLARGRFRKLFPERLLGRSTWWWLQQLGLLSARRDSAVGRRMQRLDPFPKRGNDDRALSMRGISLMPRLMSVVGAAAVFSDGSRIHPKAVVWATGYNDDFGWIEIDGAVDAQRQILHEQGISPIHGLYVLGRPWQRNRASALIAGVGDDAAVIVNAIRDFLAGDGLCLQHKDNG